MYETCHNTTCDVLDTGAGLLDGVCDVMGYQLTPTNNCDCTGCACNYEAPTLTDAAALVANEQLMRFFMLFYDEQCLMNNGVLLETLEVNNNLCVCGVGANVRTHRTASTCVRVLCARVP